MVARTKSISKRERIYTEEEFMNLPDEGKHFELWEGKLIEVMSPNVPHGRIAARITQKLLNHTDEINNGTIYSNDTFFRLGPGTIVGADIAFVAAGRFTEEPIKEMPFAPDLAVEVNSPSVFLEVP